MRSSIFLLVLVFAAACGERPEFQFATGKDALASTVAQQGWVPEWLPPDAKNVRLLYDLDTNEIWVACEVVGEDRAALVSGLAPVPSSQGGVVAFRNPSKAWWPHSKLGEGSDKAVDVFSGNGRTILIEREGGHAFIYKWAS